MSRTSTPSNLDSRVSSLETSMATLAGSVDTLTRHIDSLRNLVTDQQRPQWGNLIGAVGLSVTLVSAIGASYIAPLTVQLSHHNNILDERRVTLNNLQDRMRDVEALSKTNTEVMAVDFKNIRENLIRVDINGSGITRERLAVIESQLKARDAKPPPKE